MIHQQPRLSFSFAELLKKINSINCWEKNVNNGHFKYLYISYILAVCLIDKL